MRPQSIAPPSGDDRAVAPVIGVVILFGFLILTFSVYQVEAVPQQNAEAEFAHFEEVQNEFIVLRNAISRAGQNNVSQYESIRLGTTYQQRLFAVNPPPPAGTLQTRGPYDATVNGTTVQSRFLEYRNGYNELSIGSLWYDNSVVYLETETGRQVIYQDQNLVTGGGQVRVTVLQNAFQESGTGRQTVEFFPAEGATVTNDDLTGEINIGLPTRLNNSYWNDEIPPSLRTNADSIDESAYPDDSDVYQLQLTVAASNLLINTVGISAVPQDTDESVQQNVGVRPDESVPPGNQGVGENFQVSFKQFDGDNILLTFRNENDIEVNVTQIALDSYTDASRTGNAINRIIFQGDNSDTVLMEDGNLRGVDVQTISNGGSQDYTISAERPSGGSGKSKAEPIESGDEFIITLEFGNGDTQQYTISVPSS